MTGVPESSRLVHCVLRYIIFVPVTSILSRLVCVRDDIREIHVIQYINVSRYHLQSNVYAFDSESLHSCKQVPVG